MVLCNGCFFAQVLRPEEMPVPSFLTRSPGAVRGTAETMDEHDVRLSATIRGNRDFVKTFGIRSHTN